MSEFARHYPDDYDERIEQLRVAADEDRKHRRENPPLRRSLEAEPERERLEELAADEQTAREEAQDEEIEAAIKAAGEKMPRLGPPLAGLPRESRVEGARRLLREAGEAERLHDTEPGRWGDHASPARMRRDIQRDRDEERDRD